MDHVITLSTAILLFDLILHFSIGAPISFAALFRDFTDISARMDMVVILSARNGVFYDDHQEHGYAELHGSNLLRIGDEWTKLAIVSASGQGEFKPWILMNLTSDGRQFEDRLSRWAKERAEKQEANHVLKLAEAFDLIRTEIFSKTTPGRAKTVFFMMTSAPEQHMDTVKAAKTLREEEGALIYMMVKGKGTQAESDRHMAMNYTGDPSRVVVCEDLDDFTQVLQVIRELTSNALYTDLCQWNHKCQCDQSKGPCNEIYVLPYLVDPIDEECRRLMPTTLIGNCTNGTTTGTTAGRTTGTPDQPPLPSSPVTTTSSSLTAAEKFAAFAGGFFMGIQVLVATRCVILVLSMM